MPHRSHLTIWLDAEKPNPETGVVYALARVGQR